MVAPCLPVEVRSPLGMDFLADSAGVKKISLTMLVTRFGPLEHEVWFGGFFRGQIKPGCFLLMKNSGVCSNTPGRVFFTKKMLCIGAPLLDERLRKVFLILYKK